MCQRGSAMRNNRGDRGVTLVEVLIAMTILLIVFMGLIQASVLAIGANMRNEIRDEVVSVASQELTRLRNLPFTHADLTPTYVNCDANPPDFNNNRNNNAISTLVNAGGSNRQIRNLNVTDILEPAGNANIGLRRDVCNLVDADHKVITVRINWQWQGEVSAIPHRVSTYRGR